MLKILSVIFVFTVSEAFAFGLTADQMYRNVLTQENDGILPSYYTVREKAEKQLNDVSSQPEQNTPKRKPSPTRENPFALQESPFSEFDIQREWESVINAVKENRMTPFDLEIIRRHAENDDTAAIELLAWMYATGKGLKRDLVKSWIYYTQAAHLGVQSATKNAQTVYRGMTAAQRAELTVF